MTTTADNITDAQIQTLRAEAAQHRDWVQVAVCDVAMATSPTDDIPESCDGHFAALEATGIIPGHIGADLAARAECARVIADAEAQS